MRGKALKPLRGENALMRSRGYSQPQRAEELGRDTRTIQRWDQEDREMGFEYSYAPLVPESGSDSLEALTKGTEKRGPETTKEDEKNRLGTGPQADNHCPSNWIQSHIDQHGYPPQIPSWLLPLLPGMREGDPLPRVGTLTVPNLGFFNQLRPSRQRMIEEYVEWRGEDEDFEWKMKRITPAVARGLNPEAPSRSMDDNKKLYERFRAERETMFEQASEVLSSQLRKTLERAKQEDSQL